MTRGLSRQQWNIIQAVQEGNTTIEEITYAVLRWKYGTPKQEDFPRLATEKEKISVRRSILNLEKKGYMKSYKKGYIKIIGKPPTQPQAS